MRLPKVHLHRERKLELLHVWEGVAAPHRVVELPDGIMLCEQRGPELIVRRIAGPDGRLETLGTFRLPHAKIEPLWQQGDTLTYLGELLTDEGRERGGQALYQIRVGETAARRLATYTMGTLHYVARRGNERFFERIGEGHDVYCEDGFLMWDVRTNEVVERLEALPQETLAVVPRYMHSFSHRQNEPYTEFGGLRFSLRRTRAGNDATWALDVGRGAGAPRAVTSPPHSPETDWSVSCVRRTEKLLLYLTGPAVSGPGADVAPEIQHMLVCHPVGSAEEPVVIECGSAAKFRLSAGRASLFHVHGELVIVCTDRVRFFRLV